MTTPAEPPQFSPAARKRRRVSVALILALSFGLLVFLSVGSVLALTVGANYRNTLDLLGARSILLVDAMEDSLRAHLGRARTRSRASRNSTPAGPSRSTTTAQ